MLWVHDADHEPGETAEMDRDELSVLDAAHDGPISPAARAGARWGAGALARLARAADAALLEARLVATVAALARIRRAAADEALARLVLAVSEYRRAALARRTHG
jgi:hypothetical protein